MANAYLMALRSKYDEQQKAISGLQQRAVDDNRALTDDEMRSVTEMGEELKTLAKQIEDLSEIEQRNAKVAELASVVTNPTDDTTGQIGRSGGGDGDTKTRQTGNAQTRDRDPGHYRQGGDNSFFGDLYRAKNFNDDDAARRLHEHQRALSTGTQGAGVVPPKWLTDEFEMMARQGRMLANAVRPIPLGDDPRPLTLPKQTAGTDSVVTEQTAENDSVSGTDAWDSDVDTVSPKPTAGKQTVSRQMLDMSSPAIDQLIYGDLIGAYNTKVEAKVANAVLAAGPAALPAAPVGGNTAGNDEFHDVTLDAAIAVRSSRKMPAAVAAMSVGRYGKFLSLKDADGRPLIPNPGTGQAVNVMGVGSVAVDGIVHGLGIVATDGVPDDGTDSDTFAVLRPSDTLLFESNMLRFRFEEQAGPESVVLGIWGYTAVLVRQGGKGVQTVTVDPA